MVNWLLKLIPIRISVVVYLMVTAILLAYLGVTQWILENQSYQEGEIRLIYTALDNSLLENMQSASSDMFPTAYLLLLSVWIRLFGHFEAIAWYLSLLLTVITLSATYRLGKELYGITAGLWAMLLLGAMPTMLPEVSEYALLVCGIMLSSVMYVLWIRKDGRFPLGLLYVIGGVMTVYASHLGVYVILIHVLFTLLFVREYRRDVRVHRLFITVGLCAVLGWGIGIIDNSFDPIAEQNKYMYNSSIISLLTLLVVSSLLIPSRLSYNSHAKWRYGYSFMMGLGILVVGLFLSTWDINRFVFTFMVIVPFVCILAGFGVRKINSWSYSASLVILFVLVRHVSEVKKELAFSYWI